MTAAWIHARSKTAMGLYEIGVSLGLLFWLVALIDIAIGKFTRWYYQLGWLFAMFVMPFSCFVYLFFGRQQVVRGGLGMLRGK